MMGSMRSTGVKCIDMYIVGSKAYLIPDAKGSGINCAEALRNITW